MALVKCAHCGDDLRYCKHRDHTVYVNSSLCLVALMLFPLLLLPLVKPAVMRHV